VTIETQQRRDVKNQENSERRGGLQVGWSNGRRKYRPVRSDVTAEASSCGIVLDLEDLTLVDQDVVSFFRRCEADGIELKNCPAYIGEWIHREDTASSSRRIETAG